MNSYMNAAFIRATGGAEAIVYGRRPTPVPGSGQLLLRMEAVAVNHVDLLVRSGAYATDVDFPFIVGRDVVGIVCAVGDDADGFVVGQRVWCNSLGHAGRQGSFAEFVLTEALRTYHLPEGINPVDAVAVLHGGATAYLGLLREARISTGDSVAILGAAGAVGSMAVQFAAASGCRVIAVAAAHDAQWMASLGADEVLDYKDPLLERRLGALLGDGPQALWDTSGSMPLARQLSLVHLGARIVHSTGGGGNQQLDATELYRKDLSLHGFAISNASVQDLAAAANYLNTMFAGPGIKTRIGTVLPLSQTASAHRMLENGSRHGIGGKIVLVPEDSTATRY